MGVYGELMPEQVKELMAAMERNDEVIALQKQRGTERAPYHPAPAPSGVAWPSCGRRQRHCSMMTLLAVELLSIR
jgi:hypothetical protein